MRQLATYYGTYGFKARLRLAGSAFVMIALAGCATPNFAPAPTEITPVSAPILPPTDWAEPAPDALPQTDWVARFNDSVLNDLVAEAVADNNTILAAGYRLEAAAARERIAGSGRLPTVSANGSVSRTERANEFIPDATGLRAGVSASWEPDFWGRISNQINSAETDSAALRADYASARLSIVGQVAQTWFDLIEARLLTELSLRDLETQERALRLTQRRFEGGVAGSSDVRLARSSVANAQALQASRRQARDATARRLEILLADYPADALEATADLPDLPILQGAGAPAILLTQRPDIIALERRLAQQGLRIDLARKALLPRLTLTGDIDAAGGGLGSFFDLDALAASIAAGLTAPIFQGGRLRADVAQQEALLRVQLEQYASTVLQAYLEVENALDAETRLAEREAALRVSVDEAQEAENRLELRYTEGLATILQLLDAQSRRLNAEGQLIGARAERLANRVRLHVALGGGDFGDLPNPLPPTEVRTLPQTPAVFDRLLNSSNSATSQNG